MGAGADRHVSGIPRPHLIDRPRLDSVLRGRFEHRVTTISAPAGSGKTSVVALAIENNLLDPHGIDVYVPLSSADDSPAGVRGRILAGLGHPGDDADDDAAGLRHVVDAVWTHAPDDVALILDDAHVLVSPETQAALADIVEHLPTNGHVVFSSRRPAPVPVARLRAHRDLLELDHRHLGFDDEELAALRRARDAGTDVELPRHAATADLCLAAGAAAGTDFLREEVLASLTDARVVELRRLSVLDDLDRDIIVELTDGRFDADGLLTGLPLVEWRTDGTIRLHALLREALAADWDRTERRKACAVAAEVLADRQQFAAAIRLSLEADDEIAARDIARVFVSVPTMNQSAQQLREITELIERIDDDGPLVELLRAGRRFNGLVPQSIVPMREIADAARERNDDELESLALHRSFQAQVFDLDLDGIDGPHLDRLEELAERIPFARGALAHLRSQLAQVRGDAGEAMARLDDYDGLGHENRLVTVSQRLCDLGRVEAVGEGLTPDDLAGLPAGSEVFIAFAMWLRGEETPEFAHEFVGALLVDVTRRGVPDTLLSTLGVATSIALAVGDVDEARRRTSWANDLVDERTPNATHQFAIMAQASVAAMTDGDDAAGEVFRAAPDVMDVDRWPKRAHLLALPLVYATCPEARPTLDRIEMGPALTTAVRAGQAIVAHRDGHTGPARDLPWTQLTLLRVHVLPHHLTELACAAAAAGSRSAADALAQIPDVDRHLARLADGTDSPAARHAADVLGSRPRTAPHDVHVELLGSMQLRRDGELVDDADWTRRTRVRELLAVLCTRRQIGRADLLAELWPDHDDEGKADANLRSTLSRLQRVLEPERTNEHDPFFLRNEGDALTLHSDVTTDVERFERSIDHARQADDAGSPARAVELYREAVGAYRGEFALGVDAGWMVLPRMRLRSLATNAMCRIGELTAARGEPEEAARWAQRAQSEDPLNQRAAAIFVGALGAAGDRTGAAGAVASFEASLADAGVAPESATLRVFDRWR